MACIFKPGDDNIYALSKDYNYLLFSLWGTDKQADH